MVVDELRGSQTRAAAVAEMEQQLLEMYADPALDRKPELLGQRGGAFYSEAAVALLASLVNDTGDVQVVNLRNAGTLPFLPDEAVIEVPAVIGAGGPVPVPVSTAEPAAGRAGRARLRVRGAGPGRRAARGQGPGAESAAGQSARRAVRAGDGLADRLIAENAHFLGWTG